MSALGQDGEKAGAVPSISVHVDGELRGREAAPTPLEKGGGWSVRGVRRPFLETLKRTDKECRRAWLCCGRRQSVELSSAERYYSKGDVATAKSGELDLMTVVEEPGAPSKVERPTWRGLLALLFACLFCISGSCIMWSTDTFDNFVANQMILDGNKSSFAWWITPPISPWFKVYIWNYTNWDEYRLNPNVKLKLQEVGPFTYKETIKRVNIKFDDAGNTLTYSEVKSYEFLPEMSNGDPNGTVVVPSLPFFGAKATLNFFWPTLSIGLELLKLNQPLVTLRAHDFIWGYDDELFNMAKMMPMGAPAVDRVGLLTAKSIPDNMTILTGRSDIDKLTYFVRYNNKRALEVWPDASCNRLDGSDGSMFPPRTVRAMQPVYAFKAEACRLIKFVFQRESSAQGVTAYRYIMDRATFASPRSNPDNRCFCRPDRTECAPDGLFDTSPCAFGAPTLISYPHFYLTDPAVLEPFEGLHPDPEEHDMYADVHPRLGVTLYGRSRLQLNLRVTRDIQGLRKGLILPVAWFAQDVPSYDSDFQAMLLFSTYGLNALEFVLLYVLPLVAVITAFVVIRRLLVLARSGDKDVAVVAEEQEDAVVTTAPTQTTTFTTAATTT